MLQVSWQEAGGFSSTPEVRKRYSQNDLTRYAGWLPSAPSGTYESQNLSPLREIQFPTTFTIRGENPGYLKIPVCPREYRPGWG